MQPALEIDYVYSVEDLAELFELKPHYLRSSGGLVAHGPLNSVLLFTHPPDETPFAYGDRWEGSVLLYAGRGQSGDQLLQGLNRDVAENRRRLWLFEHVGNSGRRFRGNPVCRTYWWEESFDKNGATRRSLRFALDTSAPVPPAEVGLPQIGFAIQTVVICGNATPEGAIVEAVSLPWFEIVQRLQKDPAFAYQIPPRIWEEVVAGAYERAGFDQVILTPRSGDLGRDIIASKRALGTIRVIDQVKAFRPDRVVTADHVRALVGTLYADGASKGFVTTTSTFAPLLRKDPLVSPLIPSRLGLIDGPELLVRLRELSARVKQ